MQEFRAFSHERHAEAPLFRRAYSAQGRPVCDSLGRVYPSAQWAARLLGGNPVAMSNALKALRDHVLGLPPKVDAAPVRAAIVSGGKWRGLWWRYLSKAEIRAVPRGTRAGDALPGIGWGLTCNLCGHDGRPLRVGHSPWGERHGPVALADGDRRRAEAARRRPL